MYTGGSVCGLCAQLLAGTMASSRDEWSVFMFALTKLCKSIYVPGDQGLLTGNVATSPRVKTVRHLGVIGWETPSVIDGVAVRGAIESIRCIKG